MKQTTPAGLAALLALFFLLAAQPGRASAQAPTRSTRDGVYTADQAAKGQDLYRGKCQSCHTTSGHSGRNFQTNWAAGRPLAVLFSYISQEMPQDAPASLSADESTQLVAYLLRLNGLPAGSTALPSTADALQGIKFEGPADGTLRR
jgi:S-disulfanyl-L-cysteine oxidoreductase SoxD